jgi:hypothetical protein
LSFLGAFCVCANWMVCMTHVRTFLRPFSFVKSWWPHIVKLLKSHINSRAIANVRWFSFPYYFSGNLFFYAISFLPFISIPVCGNTKNSIVFVCQNVRASLANQQEKKVEFGHLARKNA